MTNDLTAWLQNGEMAQHNPELMPGKRPSRHPALAADPVVKNGQAVERTKPGNWQGSEHDLQAAVFNWAETVVHDIPELAMMFAIPNGQYRRGMRMEPGLMPGVPDILLAVPCGKHAGLFLELKVGKNTLSEAQEGWCEQLMVYGYDVAVCRDLDSVQARIVEYLNG